MKKNLLITYDYELFLGNLSGKVNECLIEPTSQILSVLEKFNVKAIFFVDTTYLIQLKERSYQFSICKNDFDTIALQLQQIILAGHYVFPHIHPHWMEAEYLPNSNEWKLNIISKYRFHNLSKNERERVFDDSIQFLNSIILPIHPDYKIDCYRAGGWCIQPFDDFKPLFLKYKFKYDMSVLRGFYLFSSAHFFDFSSAPKKDIYHFEDDVLIETPAGRFTQFPISSIHINSWTLFLDKIWLKYLYRIKRDHSYSRGQGQKNVTTDMQSPSSPKGDNFLTSKKERIATELLTISKLSTYLKFINKNNYMHFISHPKMLIQHNHKMFEKFLRKVYDKYEIESDFRKMI